MKAQSRPAGAAPRSATGGSIPDAETALLDAAQACEIAALQLGLQDSVGWWLWHTAATVAYRAASRIRRERARRAA